MKITQIILFVAMLSTFATLMYMGIKQCNKCGDLRGKTIKVKPFKLKF